MTVGCLGIEANKPRVAIVKGIISFSPQLLINACAGLIPKIVVSGNMKHRSVQRFYGLPVPSPLIPHLAFVWIVAINHVSRIEDKSRPGLIHRPEHLQESRGLVAGVITAIITQHRESERLRCWDTGE